MNDVIGGAADDVLLCRFTVHGFDDVAALAHTAQGLLTMSVQPPLAGTLFLRKAEALQIVEPPCQKSLPGSVPEARRHQSVVVFQPAQLPVESGQSVGGHVGPQLACNLAFRTRAEFEADQGGGAFADSGGQVVPGEYKVFSRLVLAPDDDMNVRMPGVEMVRSHPVETGPKVAFHLRHQAARQGPEVVVRASVLRGQDKAELMPVAFGPLKKAFALHPVVVRTVELSPFSSPAHAIALNIAQVGGGPFHSLSGQLDNPCLDDDAAMVRPGLSVPVHKPCADSAAAPDPAAGKGAFAPRPSRQPG